MIALATDESEDSSGTFGDLDPLKRFPKFNN